MIMSSWPPTSPRSPTSTRMVRTSTPYRSDAASAWRRNEVDAGVAEGEGFAVDLDGAVLQRPDEVVGGVLQGEQVAAVLPAVEVGDGDERLDRAVAGTGAVPGEGGVDAGDAFLDGDDGVGDRQGEVLVGVDADLGAGVEDVAVGTHPLADAVHRSAGRRSR